MFKFLLLGKLQKAIKHARQLELDGGRREPLARQFTDFADQQFQRALDELGIDYVPVTLEAQTESSSKPVKKYQGTLVHGKFYDFDFWRINPAAPVPAVFSSAAEWRGAAHEHRPDIFFWGVKFHVKES